MTKIALVTGASRGIGRAIALKLAQDGHHVVVNYSGNVEKANEVVEEIKTIGQQAITLQCDVSDHEAVKAMIKEVVEHFGAIDIIVNNAGITKDTLMMRMKAEDFKAVIDTNLLGVFNVVQASTRQLLKQKSGKIINLSSIVGSIGNAGQANYVASKAGVEGLTKTFARELASRGITVNAVAPGFIVSDMTDKLSDEIKSDMLSQIPLNHFGAPEDIANVVSFLASEQANYITGQTIHVNGGMYMH